MRGEESSARCLSRSEGVGGDVTEGPAYAHICSCSQLETTSKSLFVFYCWSARGKTDTSVLSMELLLEDDLRGFAAAKTDLR